MRGSDSDDARSSASPLAEEGRQGLDGDGIKRRWWRPGQLLSILAALVALIVVAAIGVDVGMNSSGAGPSPRAVPASAASLSPPTSLVPLRMPDGTMSLSWELPNPRPIGYRIYRGTGRHTTYTIVGSVNAPGMNNFIDNGPLTPGVTYAYIVTSYNHAGESRPSEATYVAVVLPPTPVPTVVPVPARLPTFAPATAPAVLPTFVPVTAPTLTALARQPRQPRHPRATPSLTVTPGVATNRGVGPTVLPVPTAAGAPQPSTGSAPTTPGSTH